MAAFFFLFVFFLHFLRFFVSLRLRHLDVGYGGGGGDDCCLAICAQDFDPDSHLEFDIGLQTTSTGPSFLRHRLGLAWALSRYLVQKLEQGGGGDGDGGGSDGDGGGGGGAGDGGGGGGGDGGGVGGGGTGRGTVSVPVVGTVKNGVSVTVTPEVTAAL